MKGGWRGALIACLAISLAIGCSRNAGEGAAAEPLGDEDRAQALVEERDEGKLEWVVGSDGRVRVEVTPNQGDQKVSGALLIEGQSYPLAGEGRLLSATGPKLTSELTTITYSLKVGDATWEGVLHVPPGGTKELVAMPSVNVPEGTRGPNGGVVDVVGDQRVEIVTDEKTGEVRVYFLDENLKPIPVKDVSATLAVVQEEEVKK